MPRYRFTRPPRLPKRRGLKLDNMALVPASMLPLKKEYQELANRLPKGSVLLCATTNRRLQRIIEKVADHLRAKGDRVTTLPAERLRRDLPDIRAWERRTMLSRRQRGGGR